MQAVPDESGVVVLRHAAEECYHCGLCTREYCNARPTSEDIGAIAEMALKYPLDGSKDVDGVVDENGIDSNHVRNEAVDWARRCALCDQCTQGCPAGISCKRVMWAIREAASHDPAMPDYYRMMRTNFNTNNFTLLQELMGIQYADDAIKNPVPAAGEELAERTLFMPGCTLETYAPELTAAIFAWLKEHGVATRMTSVCCGNPVMCTGDREASAAYRSAIAERLAAGEFTRVVTACPNCAGELHAMANATGLARTLDIVALPQVFDEAGLKVTRESLVASGVDENAVMCVHDSCPDRIRNEFGAAVRSLLSELPQVEREHHGQHTTCCGSGALCTSWMHEIADERGTIARAEVAKAGGTCIVTSCVSCTNAYSRVEGDASGDAAGTSDGIAVRNYLELLFGVRINWPALREAQERMYSEQGLAWRSYHLQRYEPMLPPLNQYEYDVE